MRAHPSPPIGDGAEYDAEDAEIARRKRLGATAPSHDLNAGVDNPVTQSVHIDLHENRPNQEEAMTVINRFLSLMTWCDDQFAIAQGGWSGNPVPVAIPKRNLAFTTAYHWLFNRGISLSDEVRRAIALYREARNAEQNFMVSYAVLNYYKMIEIHHQGCLHPQNDASPCATIYPYDLGCSDSPLGEITTEPMADTLG